MGAMFREFVAERFGITLPEWISIKEGRRVWLFVDEKEFDEKGVEVFNRGINAGKRGKWGYKPSSSFLQLFGFMATRNIVFVDDEGAKAFMSGKTVERFKAYGSDGYVAVFYKGRCIGCGLLLKGKLISQMPKWRRV